MPPKVHFRSATEAILLPASHKASNGHGHEYIALQTDDLPDPTSNASTPPRAPSRDSGVSLSPSSQRIFDDFTSRFSRAQRQPLPTPIAPPHITLSRRPRPNELPPTRVVFILFLLYLVTIFYGLDGTVVATLATPISSGFGQLHRAAWLNSSYLLSVACCTPLYGKLSDIVGRRTACVIGLGLFILGSAMCGIAGSMNVLIFARLLQGAGGGGSGLLGAIITSDIVTLRTRGLLNGIGAVCWATGAGLGGFYGGLVADTLGWRWAFLLQLPPLLLILLGLYLSVTYAVPGENGSWRAVGQRLDWTGAGLLVIGIGSLVFALAFKTNEGLPWTHPLVYGTLLLSLLTTLGFVYVEEYVAPEPVLALRLLKDTSRLAVACSTFLASAATIAIGLFFPMLLQIVRGNSASSAGLHLMPNTVASAFGGVISGFYIRTTGKYYILIILLSILQTLPCFALAQVGGRTWEFITWVVLMPQGFGGSGFNGSTFIALLSTVNAREIAGVTSIQFLFRSCGQVIGMAMSSAIQQSVLEKELTAHVSGEHAAAIVSEVRRNATYILDLEPAMRDASVTAYATSLHAVFFANGFISLAAIAFVFFIKEHPLSDSLPSGDEDDEDEALHTKLAAEYEFEEAETNAL